ncbi:MAG TPA: hypothetical protein VF328_07985, partial [Mycobacterium sp.]
SSQPPTVLGTSLSTCPRPHCIGIRVLDCRNATAPARCGSIWDAATVRRDPASNSTRAWVFRETDRPTAHAAAAEQFL